MAGPDLVKPSGNLKLTSSSFASGGPIDTKYTMYGQNISPQLAWSGVPAGTGSLALVCSDPDAMRVAGKEWLHWAVVDIPPSATGFAEGQKELPAGSRQLRNDYGKESYGGPQPPKGTGVHHYIFALYAVKAKSLPVKSGANLAAIRDAIRKEASDMATVAGTYEQK